MSLWQLSLKVIPWLLHCLILHCCIFFFLKIYFSWPTINEYLVFIKMHSFYLNAFILFFLKKNYWSIIDLWYITFRCVANWNSYIYIKFFRLFSHILNWYLAIENRTWNSLSKNALFLVSMDNLFFFFFFTSTSMFN